MRKRLWFFLCLTFWVVTPFFVTLPLREVDLKGKAGFFSYMWGMALSFVFLGTYCAHKAQWSGVFFCSLPYLLLGVLYRDMGRRIGINFF